MVSVEIVQTREVITGSVINEESTSPRISFSSDFLDERNFISVTPQSSHHHHHHHHQEDDQGKKKLQENNGGGRNTNTAADFEFLSITNGVSSHKMLTADELFFEGKLLPFWQIPHSLEKLHKINLNNKHHEDEEEEEEENPATANSSRNSNSNSSSSNNNNNTSEAKVSWFVDDDPSPRLPKCTVLWKELLRLKKQRASSSSSSLSPSSSSSSSTSSSSSSSSLCDIVTKENKNFNKRIKKGLERTRSVSIIRIRPMVNVPIYTQQVKRSAFPPRFSSHEKKIIREVK